MFYAVVILLGGYMTLIGPSKWTPKMNPNMDPKMDLHLDLQLRMLKMHCG